MESPAKSDTDGHVNDAAARPLESLAVGEKIYQSLDPLDPRKVSLDMFELYCQEMLVTTFVGRRAFLIKNMRYMIHRLIGHQYDYGRLYNRTCVANLVARVCGRYAYLMPDEEIEEGDQSYNLVDCLVDFTSDKWSKVIVQFEHLRESMLRNDASLIVLPSKLDDENGDGDSEELLPEGDEEINEELASHAYFSEGYTKMLDWLKFHTCLSHLQPQLETAIQKGSSAESVVIPHDNIVAFDSAIEEQFGDAEDNKYARILNDLLEVNKKINLPTRYGGLHLKSFSEIKNIYAAHAREFDLERFQYKFLQLIRRWTDLVLPVPELTKLNYGSTNGSSDNITRKPMATVDNKENIHAPGADVGNTPSSFAASTSGRQQQRKSQKGDHRKPPPAAIDTSFENEVDDDIESSSEEEKEETMDAKEVLKRKRKALMKNVKDPLDNCVEIAQSARTRQKVGESSESEDESSSKGDKAVKTPSFRKQKKSAHQIKFDSSDSEGEDMALSEVPARLKTAKHGYTPPEIPVRRKFPTVKKRVRFTEVEDRAIRNGVVKFKVGKWAEIKSHYAMELRNRDTGQIKDRWRTMTK